MKRIYPVLFILVFFCLLIGVNIRKLNGLFSDYTENHVQLHTSKLDVVIDDFKMGIMQGKRETEWNVPDSTGAVNATLIQDGILEIQFTLRNQSSFDVNVNGTMELFFVNEASEKNALFLYPGNVEYQEIQDSAQSNGDGSALIGYNTDDTNKVSSPHGERSGYRIKVVEDTISATGSDSNAKTYTYKLHLSKAKIPMETLKKMISNNKVGIGVHVDTTPQNNEIKWTASEYVYGEVATATILPPALYLELDGIDTLYVTQNNNLELPKAHAEDENGNKIDITVSGNVDFSKYGVYTIEYKAEYNGLVEVKTLTVYVTDGEAPQIIPEGINIEKFVSPSLDLQSLVTYKDNVDDIDTLKKNLIITTSESYDSKKPGVYEVCYNLSDRSGMKANEQCINLTIFAYDKVTAMFDTTLALTTHGRVYSWGYGENGETGRGEDSYYLVPGEITKLREHNIVQIEGGMYHGMALSDKGQLFMWGYDGEGVQGNGTALVNRHSPEPIDNLGTVVQIASKYYTALALNNDGDVYVWGNGYLYASGTKSHLDVYTPTKLEFPDKVKIKYISMGYYTGYAISVDDNLYSWGYNLNSIALGDGNTDITKPKNVTSKLPLEIKVGEIKTIAIGESQVYLLKQDGTLYSWGYNGSGQLGNGETASNREPIAIPFFKNGNIKIDQVVAGTHFGLALDEQGKAYGWGYSEIGAFGKVGTYDEPTPLDLNATQRITSMGAHHATSGLITSEGYLYMSGSNNLGELGINILGGDYYKWKKTLNP